MFLAHVVGGEDGNKPGGSGGAFNISSATCFFAFHQAHHADDFKSELARGFDRLNGGGAGGADVIHDDHARAFFLEAFDALSCAVLFFRFADEETVHSSTHDRARHHDGIGAHRA